MSELTTIANLTVSWLRCVFVSINTNSDSHLGLRTEDKSHNTKVLVPGIILLWLRLIFICETCHVLCPASIWLNLIAFSDMFLSNAVVQIWPDSQLHCLEHGQVFTVKFLAQLNLLQSNQNPQFPKIALSPVPEKNSICLSGWMFAHFRAFLNLNFWFSRNCCPLFFMSLWHLRLEQFFNSWL